MLSLVKSLSAYSIEALYLVHFHNIKTFAQVGVILGLCSTEVIFWELRYLRCLNNCFAIQKIYTFAFFLEMT